MLKCCFYFQNHSQSVFVSTNTSSNEPAELSGNNFRESELEEIFDSRKKKIQEVCQKYQMKKGQASSKIFQSILCFHQYEVIYF